jgi:hypothetical protein
MDTGGGVQRGWRVADAGAGKRWKGRAADFEMRETGWSARFTRLQTDVHDMGIASGNIGSLFL